MRAVHDSRRNRRPHMIRDMQNKIAMIKPCKGLHSACKLCVYFSDKSWIPIEPGYWKERKNSFLSTRHWRSQRGAAAVGAPPQTPGRLRRKNVAGGSAPRSPRGLRPRPRWSSAPNPVQEGLSQHSVSQSVSFLPF